LKTLIAIMLLFVTVALSGCAAPVVEVALQARDSLSRGDLEQAAAQGDAKAQYDLGDTYCCAITGQTDSAVSAYDNEKATYWMCKAAQQDYAPAAYRLARIYSGDVVSGVRILRRAAQIAATPQKDNAVALMWARRAAAQNASGASAFARDISRRASSAELRRANQLASDWQSAPCIWSQVFAAAR
jgi:TPR repeat protein